MHRIVRWTLLAACTGWLAACANSSVDSLQSSLTGGNGVKPAGAGPETAALRGDASAAKADLEKLRAQSKRGQSAYQIGAQDVLEISVFKAPELSKVVQVADTGTINLPLVGEIPAAGRTSQDVERDLTRQLGAKYLQNPQVTVFVKEYNSQMVTVEGSVKKPGVFPFRGRTSLLQSLANAGGLDSVAGSGVVVFREVDGKRLAARFDIEEIRSGSTSDPQLQAGDVIVVASSQVKETFNNIMKALPLAGAFALL